MRKKDDKKREESRLIYRVMPDDEEHGFEAYYTVESDEENPIHSACSICKGLIRLLSRPIVSVARIYDITDADDVSNDDQLLVEEESLFSLLAKDVQESVACEKEFPEENLCPSCVGKDMHADDVRIFEDATSYDPQHKL